jgi:head-tail adaptor
MTLLSTEELSALRADIAPLLTGTAIIERAQEVSDGQGGFAESWSPVGTVSARLEPYRIAGRGQETTGEIPMTLNQWVVITPAETDISALDRVKISNRYFDVNSVRSPRTDEVTTRVECSLVEGGAT